MAAIPATPGTPVNTNVQRFEDVLRVEAACLEMAQNHISYAGTRAPILYDVHMVEPLTFKQLRFDPTWLKHCITKLEKKLRVHPALADGSFDARTFALMTQFSLADSIQNLTPAVDEFSADSLIGVLGNDKKWGDNLRDQAQLLVDPIYRVLLTDDGIWPMNDCDKCDKFKNSHALAEDPVRVLLPPDSREGEGTTQGDDEDSTASNSLDKDDEGNENMRDIDVDPATQEQVNTLLGLIETYEEKHAHNHRIRENTAGDPGGSRDSSHDEIMPKLLTAARKLKVPEHILVTMSQWFTNGIYMLVQVWAQMVRHNSTLARLTSHNFGIVVVRERKRQRMTISNVYTHEHHFLNLTALIVFGSQDAQRRHDVHVEDGIPPWNDVFRGSVVEDGGPRKRKRWDDNEGDDGWDDTQGSGGEESGGGGGGLGRSEGPIRKRHRLARSNAGNEDSGGNRAGLHLNIDIQNLHLAFRVKNSSLWSTGFSCFKRIPHFDSLSSESAPARHEPSLIPGACTPLPSTHTASPPRGLGRTGSGSNISSRSLVGTLFGSQSSVGPSSPVTTSFSTESELGDSPTRKMGGKMSMSSLRASVDTSLDISEGQSLRDPDAATPWGESVPRLPVVHNVGIARKAFVWSGQMILEGTNPAEEPMPVIAKIATSTEGSDAAEVEESEEGVRIRKEGAVYELMGSNPAFKQNITPRYYGTFEDTRGSVALVLEDGGTALQSFAEITTKQSVFIQFVRLQQANTSRSQLLMEKVKHLHSIQVTHGDLVPRNIVKDNNEDLWIVDFHCATVGHVCPGDECEELVEFAQELGLGKEDDGDRT
ncbi:hypothetical protein C8J57DRAFT_1217094 [Mycena rebaudengoi]|nr:hypothetical protein C8J57DRAFT_1217094 [Mycena rebaudengoi]